MFIYTNETAAPKRLQHFLHYVTPQVFASTLSLYDTSIDHINRVRIGNGSTAIIVVTSQTFVRLYKNKLLLSRAIYPMNRC